VLLEFKQSMGARNRVGIGSSYRPARVEIDFLESIPGLLKNLKIRSVVLRPVFDFLLFEERKPTIG
jgi:hypothetical protein